MPMKTLGLIGGMSWESTALHYRHFNEIMRDRLGGLHSAKLPLWSFDFAEVAPLQHAGDWDGASAMMTGAARRLEDAGAEALVIRTNTMHKLAGAVEAAVAIPLVHIADATAARLNASGVRRPALLATRFTMEEDFYTGRQRDRHGIEAMVPDERGRDLVHRIIYEELCRDVTSQETRASYPGRDRAPAPGRGRWRHPRLHRDHHADRLRGYGPARLRHDAHSRRGRHGSRLG
jgi:aspartate racemase